MNASDLIDKQISDAPDWRGEMLKQIRQLINTASPDIKEEWKWNTGAWTSNGLVCAMGCFKNHVKVNFFKGSSLDDPDKLFNAGLDAKGMRSVDFHEGDKIDGQALQNMVRSAIKLNSK